ncbi:MAG: PDZ domain-containing protein [Pseudomonadales bacterium]|nr:PDZ domain-containing protein [Pseudomonadales bacterium]
MMRPAKAAKSTLPARLLLLCITVGAMAGAMLGAAAAYFYFSTAGIAVHDDANAAKQSMRAELSALHAELAQLSAALPADSPGEVNNLEASDASQLEVGDVDTGLEQGYLSRFAEHSGTGRAGQVGTPKFAEPNYEKSMQRLTAAGFTAYDAERIFAIEAEAHLRFIESMQNPATRGRQTANDIVADFGASLKDHLGDYGYENYLRSRNLPTDVEILRVARSSVAESSGLVKGDRVLTYDGDRVFNIQELSRMIDARSDTSSGTAIGTTTVTVEILRDGERQQISVPAGKMGIRAKPLSPGAIFELRPVLKLP